MTEYLTGIVYKICPIDDEKYTECYVGSTFRSMEDRMNAHIKDYKSWKNGNRDKVMSYDLFEKYGFEYCKIVSLKNCQVVDEQHLHAWEQLFINKLKCVNKQNLFKFEKLFKKYYEKMRYQKILKQNPNYNKEKYQKDVERNPNFFQDLYQQRVKNNPNYAKDLYQYNMKRNPNYNKDRYKKERENLLQKVQCECGSIVSKSNLGKHRKTKKHQDLMKNITSSS